MRQLPRRPVSRAMADRSHLKNAPLRVDHQARPLLECRAPFLEVIVSIVDALDPTDRVLRILAAGIERLELVQPIQTSYPRGLVRLGRLAIASAMRKTSCSSNESYGSSYKLATDPATRITEIGMAGSRRFWRKCLEIQRFRMSTWTRPDSAGRLSIYSAFCTCSRICSMSTFMSTALRVVSRSCDFDDSVLASRLSSCMRKSRRRPADSWPPITRRTSAM